VREKRRGAGQGYRCAALDSWVEDVILKSVVASVFEIVDIDMDHHEAESQRDV